MSDSFRQQAFLTDQLPSFISAGPGRVQRSGSKTGGAAKVVLSDAMAAAESGHRSLMMGVAKTPAERQLAREFAEDPQHRPLVWTYKDRKGFARKIDVVFYDPALDNGGPEVIGHEQYQFQRNEFASDAVWHDVAQVNHPVYVEGFNPASFDSFKLVNLDYARVAASAIDSDADVYSNDWHVAFVADGLKKLGFQGQTMLIIHTAFQSLDYANRERPEGAEDNGMPREIWKEMLGTIAHSQDAVNFSGSQWKINFRQVARALLGPGVLIPKVSSIAVPLDYKEVKESYESQAVQELIEIGIDGRPSVKDLIGAAGNPLVVGIGGRSDPYKQLHHLIDVARMAKLSGRAPDFIVALVSSETRGTAYGYRDYNEYEILDQADAVNAEICPEEWARVGPRITELKTRRRELQALIDPELQGDPANDAMKAEHKIIWTEETRLREDSNLFIRAIDGNDASRGLAWESQTDTWFTGGEMDGYTLMPGEVAIATRAAIKRLPKVLRVRPVQILSEATGLFQHLRKRLGDGKLPEQSATLPTRISITRPRNETEQKQLDGEKREAVGTLVVALTALHKSKVRSREAVARGETKVDLPLGFPAMEKNLVKELKHFTPELHVRKLRAALGRGVLYKAAEPYRQKRSEQLAQKGLRTGYLTVKEARFLQRRSEDMQTSLEPKLQNLIELAEIVASVGPKGTVDAFKNSPIESEQVSEPTSPDRDAKIEAAFNDILGDRTGDASPQELQIELSRSFGDRGL